MEDILPRPSGRYLSVILGSVSVSILDKKAKYDYKDQYERFKLILNLIGRLRRDLVFAITLPSTNPTRLLIFSGFAVACLCLYFQTRVLDLSFYFLTVWYYCTLTIRESILKVNGSRIKVKLWLNKVESMKKSNEWALQMRLPYPSSKIPYFIGETLLVLSVWLSSIESQLLAILFQLIASLYLFLPKGDLFKQQEMERTPHPSTHLASQLRERNRACLLFSRVNVHSVGLSKSTAIKLQ